MGRPASTISSKLAGRIRHGPTQRQVAQWRGPGDLLGQETSCPNDARGSTKCQTGTSACTPSFRTLCHAKAVSHTLGSLSRRRTRGCYLHYPGFTPVSAWVLDSCLSIPSRLSTAAMSRAALCSMYRALTVLTSWQRNDGWTQCVGLDLCSITPTLNT